MKLVDTTDLKSVPSQGIGSSPIVSKHPLHLMVRILLFHGKRMGSNPIGGSLMNID